MATKDKLEELRDVLDEWVDAEEKRAVTERDFLLELKSKGALSSVETLMPGLEERIDSDLSTFLGEDK